jgi:hypothetical protein
MNAIRPPESYLVATMEGDKWANSLESAPTAGLQLLEGFRTGPIVFAQVNVIISSGIPVSASSALPTPLRSPLVARLQ